MIRTVLSLAATLACVGLGGCGTVFDPPPYRPSQDAYVLQPGPKPSALRGADTKSPSYTPDTILRFDDLTDASSKLRALSDGYAEQRDDMMRQQMLFDIPMIGLALGSVASKAFGGGSTMALGLGAGAATVGGGKLYFAPQVKVSAYNGASLALLCGSSLASDLANFRTISGETVDETAAELDFRIAEATTISGKLSGSSSASLKQNLDTSITQAKKARDDLAAALARLAGAHTDLQEFATNIVIGATKKVVTGSQNVDAVISLIQKSATAGSSTPPSAGANKDAKDKSLTKAAYKRADDGNDSARMLQELGAKANALTKPINDKWAILATCAAHAAA